MALLSLTAWGWNNCHKSNQNKMRQYRNFFIMHLKTFYWKLTRSILKYNSTVNTRQHITMQFNIIQFNSFNTGSRYGNCLLALDRARMFI